MVVWRRFTDAPDLKGQPTILVTISTMWSVLSLWCAHVCTLEIYGLVYENERLFISSDQYESLLSLLCVRFLMWHGMMLEVWWVWRTIFWTPFSCPSNILNSWLQDCEDLVSVWHSVCLWTVQFSPPTLWTIVFLWQNYLVDPNMKPLPIFFLHLKIYIYCLKKKSPLRKYSSLQKNKNKF